MATDPQSLLDSSACYNNFSAQSWLLRLSLLRQIALNGNPSADVSPDALLSAGNCYNCFGPGVWPLIKLALLMQIVNDGGSPALTCVIISSNTLQANGTYNVSGQQGGKNSYAQVGGLGTIFWSSPLWTISVPSVSGSWLSNDDVATPDLVTTWVTGSHVSGTPTVIHC